MKKPMGLTAIKLNKQNPNRKQEENTMTNKIMKNIDLASPLSLASLVTYQQGQIVSRTLVQNRAVSLTLFAFDTGEEISSHESKGDAMVQVLDGRAKITIGDGVYQLSAGETVVMPAGVPHALEAVEPFKMLLTVVFPG
jgi:quercetin dioxygenase-like cupin family protein